MAIKTCYFILRGDNCPLFYINFRQILQIKAYHFVRFFSWTLKTNKLMNLDFFIVLLKKILLKLETYKKNFLFKSRLLFFDGPWRSFFTFFFQNNMRTWPNMPLISFPKANQNKNIIFFSSSFFFARSFFDILFHQWRKLTKFFWVLLPFKTGRQLSKENIWKIIFFCFPN